MKRLLLTIWVALGLKMESREAFLIHNSPFVKSKSLGNDMTLFLDTRRVFLEKLAVGGVLADPLTQRQQTQEKRKQDNNFALVDENAMRAKNETDTRKSDSRQMQRTPTSRRNGNRRPTDILPDPVRSPTLPSESSSSLPSPLDDRARKTRSPPPSISPQRKIKSTQKATKARRDAGSRSRTRPATQRAPTKKSPKPRTSTASSPRRTSGSRSAMSSGHGGSSCFPAGAVVENDAGQFVSMHTVAVGDLVRTRHGFSQVYAHAMRLDAKWVEFVRIKTEAGAVLEISAEHVLFTGPKMEAKLACDILVGETLFLGTGGQSKVLNISTVRRLGAYHPLTRDGTLVVNNVIVSVHSIDSVAPIVSIYGWEVLDLHQLQQLLYSPLRLLCSLSPDEFCAQSNHDAEDGSHHWVNVIENLQIFLLPNATDEEETSFLEGSTSSWRMLVAAVVLFFLLACEVIIWCNTNFRWVIALSFVVFLQWRQPVRQNRYKVEVAQ